VSIFAFRDSSLVGAACNIYGSPTVSLIGVCIHPYVRDTAVESLKWNMIS